VYPGGIRSRFKSRKEVTEKDALPKVGVRRIKIDAQLKAVEADSGCRNQGASKLIRTTAALRNGTQGRLQCLSSPCCRGTPRRSVKALGKMLAELQVTAVRYRSRVRFLCDRYPKGRLKYAEAAGICDGAAAVMAACR
jgi:hypothetical protein